MNNATLFFKAWFLMMFGIIAQLLLTAFIWLTPLASLYFLVFGPHRFIAGGVLFGYFTLLLTVIEIAVGGLQRWKKPKS